DSTGVGAVGADADLGKGDRDFYRFTAPSLTGGLQITLQRAGISLLTPRVKVYDSAGNLIASAVSTDPIGGGLAIPLSNVRPLGTYYVSVEGASGDVFDVGSYHLQIRSLPLVNSLTSTLTTTTQNTTTTLLNNDLHTNDSFLTASLVGGLLSPTV